MNESLKAKAIAASLSGRWTDVAKLCQKFLNENPKHVEMLNRLGYAYFALGKIKDAKSAYHKVLRIDSLNAIAHKNLKRIGEQNSRKITENTYSIDNSMFLEEVGKTKVIELNHIAPPRLLKTLRVGQPLQLHIKRSKIFALDASGEFIGMLSDNISKRLIKFIKGGNAYTAYIRALEDRNVVIFIKEIKRATRFKNQPSFLLHDGPKNTGILSGKKHYDVDSDDGKSDE